MKKNIQVKKFCWRIFLIVILPILIYLWIFSSYNYNFKNDGEKWVLTEGNPNLKSSVRDILNIPFESDYYNFCFIDEGGSSPYPYDSYLENGDNIFSLNITSKGEYCETIDLSKGVMVWVKEDSYAGTIEEAVKNGISLEIGNKNWTHKIELEKYSGITKFFLLLFASWAILFLIREVKKYLFECFEKLEQ